MDKPHYTEIVREMRAWVNDYTFSGRRGIKLKAYSVGDYPPDWKPAKMGDSHWDDLHYPYTRPPY
jgi:hypothetical protein